MDVIFFVDLLYVDFRLDVMGALRCVFATRVRLELADYLHLLPDLVERNAQLFCYLGEAVLLEAIEMVRYEAHCEPLSISQLLQLDKEALFAVERTDTDRIEGLHCSAGRFNRLYGPSAHLGYLLESGVEVAVLI